MRGVLQDLVGSLGLPGRVDLPGAVPRTDLPAYYGRADVFVLPSTYDWSAGESLEMWGYVLFEAAQFGLAIVATDVVGASPDLIVDGDTGLIVPHGNPTALAEALERLLLDDRLRASLGVRGRERAAEFGYEKAAVRMRHAVARAISA